MINGLLGFIANNMVPFFSGIGVSVIATVLIAFFNYKQQERFKKNDDQQTRQFNTVFGNEKPGLINAEANLLRIEQLNRLSSDIEFGECGVGVFWKFDKTTKVLEIHGYGPMVPIMGFATDLGKEEENAYYKLSKLEHEVKKVIINEGITHIENGTFACFDELEEAYIGPSIKKIPLNCFRNCVKLKHVYLPYKLEEIGIFAFRDCISLMDVDLPRNLKTIENGAFYGCSNLHKLTKKHGRYLERIGVLAFSNSGLQEVNLSGVFCIDGSAFENTEMLENVKIDYYRKIGWYVFKGSGVREIKLGSGDYISKNAFLECEHLERVEFGENDGSHNFFYTMLTYPMGLVELHNENKSLFKIPPHYEFCMKIKPLFTSFFHFIYWLGVERRIDK